MDALAGSSLAIVSVLVAVLIYRRRYASGSAPRYDALLNVAATFLGVVLGLFFTSWHETRQAKASICNVIEAARDEVDANLHVVRAASPDPESMSDEERLVLEHPARLLSTLVQMPAFLECTSRRDLAELAKLSTGLDWNRTFRTVAQPYATMPRAMVTVTADPKAVSEALGRVAALLADESKAVCE
jgi:hypothetical protein